MNIADILTVKKLTSYIFLRTIRNTATVAKKSQPFSTSGGESHLLFKGMGCPHEGPKMVRNVDIEPQKFVTYLSQNKNKK